jgi:hypothetical protein
MASCVSAPANPSTGLAEVRQHSLVVRDCDASDVISWTENHDKSNPAAERSFATPSSNKILHQVGASFPDWITVLPDATQRGVLSHSNGHSKSLDSGKDESTPHHRSAPSSCHRIDSGIETRRHRRNRLRSCLRDDEQVTAGLCRRGALLPLFAVGSGRTINVDDDSASASSRSDIPDLQDSETTAERNGRDDLDHDNESSNHPTSDSAYSDVDDNSVILQRSRSSAFSQLRAE